MYKINIHVRLLGMNVFDYDDYKQCVNDWINSQPKGGHGQLRSLANYLGVNSVVMSQVFRGDRDISAEQAVGVARFLGLNDQERNFFILMVQKARAGSKELAAIINQQMEALRQSSKVLKNRIKHAKFTEKDRATFYSQWYYSAIRLGISIEDTNTFTSIAEYLRLERSLVSKVIQFLLEHHLIVEKDGKFDLGPQVTHVGHDSPFVNRHHANWRLKGLQAMESQSDRQLFYTGPMALSRKAADDIRSQLLALIERSTKTASESTSEVLACLNVDWFRL
jgi:uncharacterized protein (TIGR02147 family)